MALESHEQSAGPVQKMEGESGVHLANISGNAHEAHEGGHNGAFHADILTLLNSPLPESKFNAKPEYKNGLASEELMKLEKWTKEELLCGTINQDQLTKRVNDFSKETDKMWTRMEHSPNLADRNRESADVDKTYPRFGNIFAELDDKHRDQVLKTLPWRLRPGD